MARFIIGAIILQLLLIKSVQSGAKVKIRFQYYLNPRGLDYDGKKCDWGLIKSACDPYFTISVTIDGYTYPTIKTDREKDKNAVQFQDKIVNVNNPLVYNVNVFQGYLNIKVNVDDYDSLSKSDHIGSFHYTAVPAILPEPFQSPEIPREVRLTDNGKAESVLFLQISIQCNTDYYGRDCSKHCLASSDSSKGFYTCGGSGNKVCLYTYDPGTDCKKTFCNQQPCKNGGTCTNLFNGFNCACPQLFGGPTCTDRLSVCEKGTPCKNGGTCRSGTGRSGCDCHPGFTGDFCELDVNECEQERPCNGSRCDNWFGSYSCRCADGWRGRNCTKDVDECAESTGSNSGSGCFNGGQCLNLPGSFSCSCPVGFNGTRCEFDIDECHSRIELCNPMTQVCQNLEGSFVCLCMSGTNCTEPAYFIQPDDQLIQILWILLPISLLIVLIAAEVRMGCIRTFFNLLNCRVRGNVRMESISINNISGADNLVYEASDDGGPYEEPSEVLAGQQAKRQSVAPPLPPPRLQGPGVPTGRLSLGLYVEPGSAKIATIGDISTTLVSPNASY